MANLLRVSLMGVFPNGEEWSVNPVWGISDFGTPTTPLQVQTVATAIAGIAPPAALLVSFAPGTQWTGVRVEARKYTGELENQAEAVKPTPPNGTGTVTHPFQTSVVQSLRTAQVGPSGRGRLYWPATGLFLGATTYRPTTAAVTALLGGANSFLTSIQTTVRATFAGANLQVWSRKQHAGFNVTSTQMGDVLDTQRRRRDTLIEAYQSIAYP